MRRLLALLLPLSHLPSLAWANQRELLQEGDLIFQVSNSAQSEPIQRATGSLWSHVGILLNHQGKLAVFEAGQRVCWTSIEDWIAQGRDGLFAVKRLRHAETRITDAVRQKWRELASAWEGKSYDLQFLKEDDSLYCSELVWKMYRRTLGVAIGQWKPLRTYNVADAMVRQILEERYAGRPPWEEPMIAPGAVFDSPLLELVTLQGAPESKLED
ncbi:MAG: YiiX/YebB-like N1pC/P60 family cysteine hydrolase [Verrucomicrobiota bacterium]